MDRNESPLQIDALLKESGMTKTALSDALGIKKQNLNAMLRNPTLETLKRLADALGVPLHRLFGQEREDDNVFTCQCGRKYRFEEITG